jgi:hypothetical protein
LVPERSFPYSPDSAVELHPLHILFA